MFFFRKRKKEKNKKLDEAFSKVTSEIDKLDESDNPSMIRRYIMDSCEHIVALAKEVEGYNSQVNMNEEYRKDVSIIVNMPPEKKERIRDTINNIHNLSKRKQNYSQAPKRLEDDTFILMQENEDHVVDDIKRIESNEIYYAKVESDVRELEAEKSRLEIVKDSVEDVMNIYRYISMGIFIMVAASVIGSFFIPGGLRGNLRLIYLIVLFIFVLAAFVIFLLMGNQRKEYRIITGRLNQTISMLNVERMRLVNVKKALNFEMTYYDVISSGELNYLWEQYLLTVKEREAERRNNIDLNFYLDRMYTFIKELNLKFEKRWVEQVNLLQNDDEIGALYDKLTERTMSLRAQIADNLGTIDIERAEIDRLMQERNFYVPEVIKVLDEVDKITGRGYLNKGEKE